MAKDLVRTRRYIKIKKFIMMRAIIQAVSLKIQILKSQASMAQAMKGVTKAMMSMNKQVGVASLFSDNPTVQVRTLRGFICHFSRSRP